MEAISQILDAKRVPPASKLYWKLVNNSRGFQVSHYANDSFWNGPDIDWNKFRTSFLSMASTEAFHNGLLFLEGHRLHETSRFDGHITTTIHLRGPKSLFLSRPTGKTKEELEASIDGYIASRQRRHRTGP